MLLFILRRFAVMVFTALCLTFIVFFMTNLYPNLEKLAKSEGNFRMDDAAVASFLDNRGYLIHFQSNMDVGWVFYPVMDRRQRWENPRPMFRTRN